MLLNSVTSASHLSPAPVSPQEKGVLVNPGAVAATSGCWPGPVWSSGRHVTQSFKPVQEGMGEAQGQRVAPPALHQAWP